MATIGLALTAPESGWQRYEMENYINDTSILTKTASVDTYAYGSDSAGASVRINGGAGQNISFKFVGSKIRVMGYDATAYEPLVNITIDGVTEQYVNARATPYWQCLNYEKTGMTWGEHTVTITRINGTSGNNQLHVDAIDIDSTGHIGSAVLADILTKRTTLASLTVGDFIECEYTATSGVAGTFANLGNASKALISNAGTATPDGKFNFICVERKAGKGGLCIADRPVQTAISWDTLNSAGLVEGKLLINNLVPAMTSETSPSGTVTYSDQYNTTYAAWKAFDSVTQGENGWCTLDAGTTHWISYEFPTKTIVNQYTIYTYTDMNYFFKTWKFQGQDDSLSWVDLDSNTNYSFVANTPYVFNFTNTTAYKSYRLYVTATTVLNQRMVLTGLKLQYTVGAITRLLTGGVNYADFTAMKVSPTMTSATAPSPYVVTTSGQTNATNRSAMALFYGSPSSYFWITNPPSVASPAWVKLDMGVATLINRYMMYAATDTYAPSSWTLEGSNNDSTWTVLDTKGSFKLNQNAIFDIPNTTAYRYYKFNCTESNGDVTYFGFNTLEFYNTNLGMSVASTVDKRCGAYPPTNEWDKHIAGSSLGGKIIAGDNNVWNYKNYWNFLRDVVGINIPTTAGGDRVCRGYYSTGYFNWTSSAGTGSMAYRPILEFAEDGTIFY